MKNGNLTWCLLTVLVLFSAIAVPRADASGVAAVDASWRLLLGRWWGREPSLAVLASAPPLTYPYPYLLCAATGGLISTAISLRCSSRLRCGIQSPRAFRLQRCRSSFPMD